MRDGVVLYSANQHLSTKASQRMSFAMERGSGSSINAGGFAGPT